MEVEHIGVILDGNRRLAKKQLQESWKGHEMGARTVERLFAWMVNLKIKELTLYAFSMQNFQRPKMEVDYLMKLFEVEFERLINDESIRRNGIKINFIGRIQLLPERVQQKVKELMEKTKDHQKHIVNFALAYGGREEIIDAMNKVLAEKCTTVDEESFRQHLYLGSYPDLIIRTGGERRTSNFLPWQSIYSEWFFLEKMWPEFEKEDLVKVIEEFKMREKRFGK